MTPHALRLLCLISSSDPIRFTGTGCMGPGRLTIDLPTGPRCAISLPAAPSRKRSGCQGASGAGCGAQARDALTANSRCRSMFGKERHGHNTVHVNGGAEQARPSHTVTGDPMPCRNYFAGKEELPMGRKPTLARVAVVRGDLALLVFSEAMASGDINLCEAKKIGKALTDWHATTRATYAAQALGDAMSRGIEDEAYTRRLVGAYVAEMDEQPEPIPA